MLLFYNFLNLRSFLYNYNIFLKEISAFGMQQGKILRVSPTYGQVLSYDTPTALCKIWQDIYAYTTLYIYIYSIERILSIDYRNCTLYDLQSMTP